MAGLWESSFPFLGLVFHLLHGEADGLATWNLLSAHDVQEYAGPRGHSTEPAELIPAFTGLVFQQRKQPLSK